LDLEIEAAEGLGQRELEIEREALEPGPEEFAENAPYYNQEALAFNTPEDEEQSLRSEYSEYESCRSN
jgi:hypothetical protein